MTVFFVLAGLFWVLVGLSYDGSQRSSFTRSYRNPRKAYRLDRNGDALSRGYLLFGIAGFFFSCCFNDLRVIECYVAAWVVVIPVLFAVTSPFFPKKLKQWLKAPSS